MLSLAQSLAKVGKKLPFSIQNDFQTHPNSLGEMMRIMNLPDPDINTLLHEKLLVFTEDNCQGLTYVKQDIWFLSSKKKIVKVRLPGMNSKLDFLKDELNLSDLNEITTLKPYKFDDNHYNHFGDIDHFNGLIFVPVEHEDFQNKTKEPILLALSTNLELVGYSFLYGMKTLEDQFGYERDYYGAACCAINPWNKLLYTPVGLSNMLYAYDVTGFFEALANPNEWGEFIPIKLLKSKGLSFFKDDGTPDFVRSTQGIAFSRHGWLYVTTTWPKSYAFGKPIKFRNHIRVYKLLTGALIGEKSYDFDRWKDPGHEFEGICIQPTGMIYIAVCNNNIKDDHFEIHRFKMLK